MKRGAVARSWTPAQIGGVALEILLAALICTGVSFRFQWLDWNEGASIHPDEYGLANTLSQLSIPKSASEYFNTRLSPLSPYQKYDHAGRPGAPGADNRMRWGQWPITCVRWVAEKTGRTEYVELIRTGRQLSALADTLTLLLLFLIGLRLHGRRTALLATALSALSVMQIQQSHFMTVDALAVLSTAAAMFCAVCAARGKAAEGLQTQATPCASPIGSRFRAGGWRWQALFGLAAGMAAACRVNLLPLLGISLVAALIAASREWHGRRGVRLKIATEATLHIALAVLCALAAFRMTQPMAFRAESGDTAFFTLRLNPDWVESMKVAAAESSLTGGGPPAEQWTGRRRLLYPMLNLVVWGMGLPLGLTACAGAAWALKRTIKDDDWRAHLLVLVWVVGYFLFMGTRRVMSMRYFLPIYPFLALLAAWALAALWRKSAAGSQATRVPEGSLARLFHAPSLAALALSLAVVTGTFAWAWAFTTVYRQPNTRIEASRWMLDHIPGAFDLHLQTPWGRRAERLAAHGARAGPGASLSLPFTLRQPSTATSVSFRFRGGSDAGESSLLHIVLSADPEGASPLTRADVSLSAGPMGPRAMTGTAAVAPVGLTAGRVYYLVVSVLNGGPVSFVGPTVANESWDEPLPLRLDGQDPFGGLYRGLTMEVRWPDNEDKRRMLAENLAECDYIVLPSQRALWSVPRLPKNYPLTLEYYRALFDGRLGFELCARFHRPFRIGPMHFSDLTGKASWTCPPEVPDSPARPFEQGPLAAEEAFSVYDHAPVWVFRKRPDFSPARARSLLNAVDLGRVASQSPLEATLAPTALMMPEDRLMEQRAGGTWNRMFHPDGILNRNPALGVMAWYGTLLLAGALGFPLAYLAMGGLPDRGYPLAKTLGMLSVAWMVWIMGSLRILPFTRSTIILGILAVALASASVLFMRRRGLSDYLRRNYRHILFVELLFLALFLSDLIIRYGNPDLWHPYFGGEKPMILAYFNAVLKSTSFPPYDPWLAGGYMNYYYFGFVVVGQMVKLLGIVPSFAYNLIIPTLFAMVGTGAFCIAYNLAAVRSAVRPRGGTEEGGNAPAVTNSPASAGFLRWDREGQGSMPRANPYLAGCASLLLVVILGNLAQARVVASACQVVSDHPPQSPADLSLPSVFQGAARVLLGRADLPLSPGNWYWDASRMVAAFTQGNEINEFPFFTFLYADLHAHMLDMPTVMLVLAWVVAVTLSRPSRRPNLEMVSLWLLGGLALGATRVTNMWDFPTCLALGGMALLLRHRWQARRWTRAGLAHLAGQMLLLPGLAVLLYLPFDRWFAIPIGSVEMWEGAKTPLTPYLSSHGLFLFILVTLLFIETVRWLAETPASVLSEAGKWLPALLLGVGAFCLCGGLMVARGATPAIVAMPVIAWSGLLLLRSRRRLALEKRLVISLLGAAMALTMFVELFAVGGDRMNTLFKVYLQVWLLLGVAAGPALAWIRLDRQAWGNGSRRVWTGAFYLLTAAAGLYPLTAAGAKIHDRFPSAAVSSGSDATAGCKPMPGIPLPSPEPPRTPVGRQPRGLDGAAFMQWSAWCDRGWFLPLRHDYEAIRWMQDHVQGSPVIAEAQSFDLYRMSSRYAWFTGLPDVVGWDWHQRQQRAASGTQFITERGHEAARFYTGTDIDQALAFMRKYDVSYIVVGPLERAYYLASGGLDKFEAMTARGLLAVAHRNPGVVIYQVAGAALPTTPQTSRGFFEDSHRSFF